MMRKILFAGLCCAGLGLGAGASGAPDEGSGAAAARIEAPARTKDAADGASTPEGTPGGPSADRSLDRPLELGSGGDRWAPAPFEAEYRARYDGVPFSARGRRILSVEDDGILRFVSDLRAVFLRVEESARMRLGVDGALQPVGYAYEQRGIAGRRTRLLDFDWTAGEVRRSGDKERVQPLEGEVFDPVSWQLALRRDVSRGRLEAGGMVEYAITDGGDPKTYAIAHRGAEAIEVPCGTFDTLLLERVFEDGDPRSTRIWLAPELGYMLVRLEAVDDSGRKLALELSRRPA